MATITAVKIYLLLRLVYKSSLEARTVCVVNSVQTVQGYLKAYAHRLR